ncbi:sigma factor AlgU negative regulatory protein [Litchfieldella qijiaojingensis]|uniref:Sigma factor AlgU negative regulatory protein n=1 Tax=Litchfieldella qijiaojingensis TaxID=980347 RepID=A0ABQ2YG81_9GAMM|nr:sigma-E factor negative regulatory protein [Halomonas qijiaojingensis]GGX81142.1 sigma factor AlgU negative regulatory protein [Halomonas qijiaojingensis]
MNQNARESLSALMDNEGDELELRRVLKMLVESPDETEVWRRYHLARSLMQRDRDIDVGTDLSAGIMARLRDEPLPEMEKASMRRQGAFSFAGSAAIAAAVSLMVITGVQFYNNSGIESEPGVVASSDSASQTTSSRSEGQTLAASNGVGSRTLERPSLVDLPLFQSPSSNRGAMTVGASAEVPMFMVPNSRQSQRNDQEQARLLQSYLDRHAEGASYRSGDAWMPLLRASGYETLGQR